MGIKDTLAAYAILCRCCARRWWSISRSWTSSMQGRRTTPTTWKPTAPGQPLPVADARRPNLGSWPPTRSAGMTAKGANGRPPARPRRQTSRPCRRNLETWLGRPWARAAAASVQIVDCAAVTALRGQRGLAGRLCWRTSSQAVGDRQRTARGGRWEDANHAVMLQ